MLIDVAALREHVGRGGPWAIESGARVRKYRMRMAADATNIPAGEVGSVRWLAEAVSVSETSINEIEAGRIVPRDYLRAAIAYVVGQDVETIWPPLTRQRAHEIGQVA